MLKFYVDVTARLVSTSLSVSEGDQVSVCVQLDAVAEIDVTARVTTVDGTAQGMLFF